MRMQPWRLTAAGAFAGAVWGGLKDVQQAASTTAFGGVIVVVRSIQS